MDAGGGEGCRFYVNNFRWRGIVSNKCEIWGIWVIYSRTMMANSERRTTKIRRRRGACLICKERKLRCCGSRPCGNCAVCCLRDLEELCWFCWNRSQMSTANIPFQAIEHRASNMSKKRHDPQINRFDTPCCTSQTTILDCNYMRTKYLSETVVVLRLRVSIACVNWEHQEALTVQLEILILAFAQPHDLDVMRDKRSGIWVWVLVSTLSWSEKIKYWQITACQNLFVSKK